MFLCRLNFIYSLANLRVHLGRRADEALNGPTKVVHGEILFLDNLDCLHSEIFSQPDEFLIDRSER